jgi:TolB-like protein/DNA-binding winged helix-turn-helix (wHTH) protein/Tfp pilus assembly protein PilF
VAVNSSQIRFGVFEVRRETRELRKHGIRIKLEDQPFEILTALLEKPGAIVTRSELQARLWPEGTFVDFDKSLTKAVNKIRTALGDSPVDPRFIETLSGRGYRFIAPVEVVADLVPGLGPDGAAPARAGRPRGASPQAWWIVAAVSSAVVAIVAVLFALNVGSLRDRLRAALDLKSAATPPGIESIAVLPLENLSRDPEQEYFADGLTDDLITDLGKMITLRVISRTSVMQYKRTKKPLPEIARELNVDAAVEGTVQRSGSRVRVTAQLLQARTDRHLWAETYERDSADVIQLERQLAVAIAHEVTGRLSPAQETRVARGGTANPRAYDAYLRGRYFWAQRTPEPARAAIGYFEQALREDPHFALAYSGLADCYAVSWWPKGERDLPLAEKYARRALALEPDLAEAHASLGIIDADRHRYPDAEKDLRRAIDLNPNYVMAHHWRSAYLLYLGRLEEALAENERARQLDPFSFPVNHLRVYALLGLHQYDRALEQAETEAAIAPQSPYAHREMARIYWIEGRVPDALAEERKAAALAHLPVRPRDLDEVAAVFARSGLRAAQVKSAQLKEKGYKGAYLALDIAHQYGLVEDKAKVLEWLNQAFRDNDDSDFGGTAPEFDCVRSTPRFHDLLRRMGLEQ